MKRYFLARLGVVFAALSFSAFAFAPASAQGWFGSAPAAPGPAVATAQDAEVAELSLRVDRLEELIRRLNGEIEVLRHRLGEGPAPDSASVNASPAAAAPPSAQPAPAQVADTVPSTGGAVGAPTSLLPLPNAAYLPDGATSLGEPPQPLGTIPESVLRGAQPGPLPGSEPAGAEYGAAMASIANPGAEAENAYAEAYGRLIAEDLPGAEAAFSGFLTRFPGHELAGNAQYWLAETFYARGDYRRAAQEFLAGYKTYASSNKAPDSLLKLGMTLAALGQASEACAAFGEVSTRFPGANPAVLERAADERARASC